ncbi:MAG: 1-acyl-sn-glycerol-3-phosphate acyltransferase [Alphaproteobacteria bacterium]|nr:1-acyl-sn-glycerol-3-phosphate acyltransferase [Alphaproteobacteria bacterium]
MCHSALRASLKLTLIVTTALVLLPLYLLTYGFGTKCRRAFSLPFFKVCLTCAGLDLKITGFANTDGVNFYISNHVSYLDIPILASLRHGLFVAKTDVASWPFIGFLAKITRTHFVSRKATDTLRERKNISHSLENGDAIFLFPEGSSSNGLDILPFKSGLLSTALLPLKSSNIVIQPISIIYGPEISPQERDYYAWYGDMDLCPHIWQLLGRKEKLEVIVTFHKSRCPSTFNDRKDLTKWAEQEIRSGLENELLTHPENINLQPLRNQL